MRCLTVLLVLSVCVSAEARELSLKDGMVLRDAEVRGVSGKNIIIVKHSGGLGMYAYSAFSPEAAEVISNLYPNAAVVLPVAAPPEPPNAGRQLGAETVAKPSEAMAIPATTGAGLSWNSKYYSMAQSRVDRAIQRERSALERQLATDGETTKLKREVSRLESLVNRKDEELATHNLHRDNLSTYIRPRGLDRPLSWDQQHTLMYQDAKDKRKELDVTEARLKKQTELQKQNMDNFEYSARVRQKAVDAIFEDHNRRLNAGEVIAPALMEANFLKAK